jgi:hypothetical protein
MEFLRGPTLPVPFNIIPMPSVVFGLCRKAFFCFSNNKSNNDDEDENAIEMPAINGGQNGHIKMGRPGKGDNEKLNHKVKALY